MIYVSLLFTVIFQTTFYLNKQHRVTRKKDPQLSIITIELLAKIKAHYKLRWHGIHGIIHWSRVYENGVRLSTQKGVNGKVVQLFSVFHDSQRENEGRDPYHGRRGAELAIKLQEYCQLNDLEFELLTTACELHTKQLTHQNVTIQACFDSDRLDLGRVGIRPIPERLCTTLGKQKETIEWAYNRSQDKYELPDKAFGLGGYGGD